MTSTYKGISKTLGPRPWKATFRGTVLGAFELEEEAAYAYDEAAKMEYKEFARLNFPDLADL